MVPIDQGFLCRKIKVEMFRFSEQTQLVIAWRYRSLCHRTLVIRRQTSGHAPSHKYLESPNPTPCPVSLQGFDTSYISWALTHTLSSKFHLRHPKNYPNFPFLLFLRQL